MCFCFKISLIVVIIFLIKTHSFLDFEYSFISQMKRQQPKKTYIVYLFICYAMRRNRYMRFKMQNKYILLSLRTSLDFTCFSQIPLMILIPQASFATLTWHPMLAKVRKAYNNRRHTTSLQQMNWHQGMWVDFHFIIMPSFFFWETLIGKGKTIALNKHLLLQKFDL